MGLLSRSRTPAHTQLDRLREEFDNALQQWWSGNGGVDLSGNGTWQPHVDISETADSIEVVVDLPGIEADDVDIRVDEHQLTIQGERREEKESKEKTMRRIERSYGSFYRSIALPAGTDSESVTALAKDGVITITVPKGAKAKTKKIAVNAD